jgi:hypothetical protein
MCASACVSSCSLICSVKTLICSTKALSALARAQVICAVVAPYLPVTPRGAAASRA